MEDLLTHAPLLFDDQPISTLEEPPLPPAPSGEPKPKYDYGSSYTRSHTIPPRSQDGQDFTPTLPPRPEQSIHPSRRTNPQPSNSDIYEQPSISPPPTQHSVDAQVPDSQSSDLKVNVASIITSATTLQGQGSLRSEPEEASSDSDNIWTDNVDVQSPKTPDTFASAMSSPRGSPRTGAASKPASRPTSRLSTARSPSPTPRASRDSESS